MMNHSRKSAKAKAVHDAAQVLPRRNDKNEITQWSSTSENGRLLRMLVENGQIKPGMSAGEARDRYPLFKEFAYSCFSSALANTRKSLATEMEAREPQTGRGGVSGCMKAYSNLLKKDGFEEDDDPDDESYQLSRMSLDDHHDDFSYDNRTTNKSVSFNHLSSGRSIHSSLSRTQGLACGTPPCHPSGLKTAPSPVTPKKEKIQPVSCALPYIVDYWFDMRPQERASIQVQMLAMNEEMITRVLYRVSTQQNELVVVLPVSQHFGEGPLAFNTHILADLPPDEEARQSMLLQWHPKTTSRRLYLAELKKKSPSANTCMEFRIPLRRKFGLDFASVAHHDPYFYGCKFIGYPDGSVFLHIELVADTVEGSNTPLDHNNTAQIFLGTRKSVPDSVSIPSGAGSTATDDDYSYMEETVMTTKTSKSQKSSKSSKSNSGAASPPATTTTAPSSTATSSVIVAAAPTIGGGALTTVAAAASPALTTTTILNIRPSSDAYSTFSGGHSVTGEKSVKSRRTVGPSASGSKRKLRSEANKND